MKKYHVGVNIASGTTTPFAYDGTVTEQTHGAQFDYCIGPFRTKRGAVYMAEHRLDPTLVSVQQAERRAANEWALNVLLGPNAQ